MAVKPGAIPIVDFPAWEALTVVADSMVAVEDTDKSPIGNRKSQKTGCSES